MEQQRSSSSKVTVEYFDPHGVYQLLSPGLLPRLPLRNLHWESHAGPLRSISSLHIDLVPSAHDAGNPSSADSASLGVSNLSRVRSQDSASGDDGFRTQALGKAALERSDSSRSGVPKQVTKERRHQIPGLRQTPYLKIFFLRCDDNDTYKLQARKEVREWIKEHTPPAQSTTKVNNQENHDAFEWLIVHVIVPNTSAATQPRTSGKNSEGSSGSATEKTTARWRGGGSTTILEKLRADFNGSSKSAVDHIAQIRIGINDVPYEMLPRVVPAIPGSYTESTQENENAWLDLITKVKSLILASFDMRVSQYEEDIREKDAQRTLPGWNFCTFFVLKEGLARGFESVGLVEDALVGYDELAVGLDAIVREKATIGAGAEHGGSFSSYTDDLKRQVERAKSALLKEKGSESPAAESEDPIDLQSTGNSPDSDEIPLNATKKRYRELILSNDVSIFDFRCYIFARQLSLLLRLANASSSQEELLAKLKEQRESSLQGVAARNPPSKPSDDAENLATLGEVCKRSMHFLAAIGRIMRDDIWAGILHDQGQSRPGSEKATTRLEDPHMTQIIDNIVASFTFAITQQILAQTSTKSLPIPPSTLAPPNSKMGLDGHEPKAAIPEPKTMMHPARSSSLAVRSSRDPPSPGLFPGGRRASLPDSSSASSTFLKPGLEDLAAHRAELYLLARNVLEMFGKERGWSVGWAEVAQEHAGEMENIDLEEKFFTPRGEDNGQPNTTHPLHGIESRLLRTALDNQDDFFRLYETLTDKALRHYTVANHMQSVQTRMADLAVLKYHLNDYAAAASYFYRMAPFYSEGGWDQIEVSMLKMYAKCLKELQRKEEYVRIVLKLLAKAAEIEKQRLLHKSALQVGRAKDLSPGPVETELYLAELLELTKVLKHEVQVPLQSFFSRIEVLDAPRYLMDNDGISLKLRLRYLLQEGLSIDKTRVRLIAASGEPGREIWLESVGTVLCKKGFVDLEVQTNTVIPGTYLVGHVILYTSNIVLQYVHDNSNPLISNADTFFKSPKLLVYHRAEAFDLKMFASRYLHLDRNRSLEVELSSGWNDVIKGELHVRSATAGLRVQISETSVISGSLDIPKKSEAGIIRFGSLPSYSNVKIRMPFTLEHEVNDISLKLEVSYTTDKGDFFFATTPTMSIMLPLGVNVQDVFKHKALFSRFTISSSTDTPLRLLRSELQNSEVFEAECGLPITRPLVVFLRQPASLLYKITKLSPAPISPPRRKNINASLSLVLHYICLDEEIDHAVTQSLLQALKDTPIYPYARLVVPAVLGQLRANMSAYDLERTAVLNEVSTSILSAVRWQDHFAGLGRIENQEHDTATLLTQLLQKWQQEAPSVSLLSIPLDTTAVAASRSIIIPVDVPPVTVVHTADLRLLENSPVAVSTAVAATNQPIPASLHIKWTTAWNTETVSKERRPSQADGNSAQPDYLDFVYEISATSDTWLIGGRRKGHFRVSTSSQKKQHKKTFPVVLIPLREGFLPYPNVEIQPAPVAKTVKSGWPETARTDSDEAMLPPSVTCETDYKNSGETIRVISDARKTTVSLDASGPQGGAWLLESERRTGGVVTG